MVVKSHDPSGNTGLPLKHKLVRNTTLSCTWKSETSTAFPNGVEFSYTIAHFFSGILI